MSTQFTIIRMLVILHHTHAPPLCVFLLFVFLILYCICSFGCLYLFLFGGFIHYLTKIENNNWRFYKADLHSMGRARAPAFWICGIFLTYSYSSFLLFYFYVFQSAFSYTLFALIFLICYFFCIYMHIRWYISILLGTFTFHRNKARCNAF